MAIGLYGLPLIRKYPLTPKQELANVTIGQQVCLTLVVDKISDPEMIELKFHAPVQVVYVTFYGKSKNMKVEAGACGIHAKKVLECLKVGSRVKITTMTSANDAALVFGSSCSFKLDINCLTKLEHGGEVRDEEDAETVAREFDTSCGLE